MDFMCDGKKMELKSSGFTNYNKIYRGYSAFSVPVTSSVFTSSLISYDLNKQGENKMADNEEIRGSQMGQMGMIPPREGPPAPLSRYRQVKIDKVANGFIVEIGCEKFVAEDWKSLAGKLGEYWVDPVKAEKKYAK